MSSLFNRRKKVLIFIVFIILAASLFYLYRNNNTETDPVEIAKKESALVKSMLSKHLVFPEGEEPDIRKINQKLEDPFFANAAIGDYLIIFYKSRIAYTYSPSKDVITNAGVVFINPQQATSTEK